MDHVHMLLCSLRYSSSLQYNEIKSILVTELSRASYHSGIEFDSRPGLKFLLQKVAQLNKAANLYKQAGAAWNLIALTLFELCLVQIRDLNQHITVIHSMYNKDYLKH